MCLSGKPVIDSNEDDVVNVSMYTDVYMVYTCVCVCVCVCFQGAYDRPFRSDWEHGSVCSGGHPCEGKPRLWPGQLIDGRLMDVLCMLYGGLSLMML